ncbi:hypothetical protein [Caudoviricetes sp.]|nr:hypothetical protein [Caudoviricetes sp.]
MKVAPIYQQRVPVSATERARQAWAAMCYETRTHLRDIGIHGRLPVLNKMAEQSRGMNAPTQLSKLAFELREAGVPRADAEERITGIARYIVALAYHDGGAA